MVSKGIFSNGMGVVGRGISALRFGTLAGRLFLLLPPLLLLTRPRLQMTLAAAATSSLMEENATKKKNHPRDQSTKNTPTKKNNILLLLTDDQDIALGSFDTASYMPKVHEKLREQGVTFEKGGIVHVPICCPSRSSLLTGKYLHHGSLAKNNSISGNCYSEDWRKHEEGHHTLAVHAKASGYTTLYAGKYLNRYEFNSAKGEAAAIPRGWDHWYGLEGNSLYYNYKIVEGSPPDAKNTSPVVRIHKHGDRYPEDYLPLVLQEYTLRMLPDLPEPWLAVIAWPTPHGPFTPEPKYARNYPDTTAPKTPSYNASEASQLPKHWLLRQLGAITNATAAKIEDIYRNRLRALKTVDNHVGKIFDFLETSRHTESHTPAAISHHGDLRAVAQRGLQSSSVEEDGSRGSRDGGGIDGIADAATTKKLSSMLDRTVVIYTSDNGFQFGQHRLSIDKRHLYEHDVRVPFVVRGPPGVIESNVTLPKETIVSTIDIAPTILEIILEGISADMDTVDPAAAMQANEAAQRLRSAIDGMDGLSFWGFLKDRQAGQKSTREGTTAHNTDDDPFVQRTDLLISYHGEGNPKCGLSECPAPLDGLWWMPDSYNNTYNCVRTLGKPAAASVTADCDDQGRCGTDTITPAEDSIYCVFVDDESFVEYYDLNKNPHQLGNDISSLGYDDIERYERRLMELLS